MGEGNPLKVIFAYFGLAHFVLLSQSLGKLISLFCVFPSQHVGILHIIYFPISNEQFVASFAQVHLDQSILGFLLGLCVVFALCDGPRSVSFEETGGEELVPGVVVGRDVEIVEGFLELL